MCLGLGLEFIYIATQVEGFSQIAFQTILVLMDPYLVAQGGRVFCPQIWKTPYTKSP